MKHQLLEILEEQRLIFILRHSDPAWLESCALATWDAGAKVVEITLNSARALDLISSLSGRAPPGCLMGAGTVLEPSQVDQVHRAGASFVVTPIASLDVLARAKELGLPAIMGASTPTEIHRVWTAGADMVKVFPAVSPVHVRRLHGPLERVSLVAVGGVDASNAVSYLEAGCKAVALGASFLGPAAGQGTMPGSAEIRRRVQELLARVRAA